MTERTDQAVPATADAAVAPPRARPNHRLRAGAVVASIVAAALVWVIAVPLFGADIQVQDNQDPPKVIELGLGPIVFMSAVFALLGWGVLAVLERFTRHARLIWTVLATVLLLVSFLPLAGEMSAATRVTLGLAHLVIGVILIPAFYRSTPRV